MATALEHVIVNMTNVFPYTSRVLPHAINYCQEFSFHFFFPFIFIYFSTLSLSLKRKNYPVNEQSATNSHPRRSIMFHLWLNFSSLSFHFLSWILYTTPKAEWKHEIYKHQNKKVEKKKSLKFLSFQVSHTKSLNKKKWREKTTKTSSHVSTEISLIRSNSSQSNISSSAGINQKTIPIIEGVNDTEDKYSFD